MHIIAAVLNGEPSSSICALAEKLGVSQRIIANKLHKFDFLYKKPRQNPHKLRPIRASFDLYSAFCMAVDLNYSMKFKEFSVKKSRNGTSSRLGIMQNDGSKS
ncbi:hypothetical protein KIN20_024035 [Parelaphostrongylus tenuis]|uniref:Uncharacterized protein n=1 Tax=Parelaphostrongylus tenuis TaxID=148309 RepID=A0AAD5QW40_PARTN|nr:hypothetical protein KIN20_024035 [Parelaphostrongylus tenuis]